jgi:hypothetical protein
MTSILESIHSALHHPNIDPAQRCLTSLIQDCFQRNDNM